MAPFVPAWGVVFLLMALLLLTLVQPCGAMLKTGSAAVAPNRTMFLAKFCFSFDPKDTWTVTPLGWRFSKPPIGSLSLSVQAPDLEIGRVVHVLVFDDEDHSYLGPSDAWEALSCEEKLRHAKNVFTIDHEMNHFEVRVHGHLRPRFWYVALSDCSGMETELPVIVNYEVHAQNYLYGQWAQEFSADKRLAPYAFLFSAGVFGLLAAAQIRANIVLSSNASDDIASSKAAHPFARMLAAGILLQLAASVLAVVHSMCYAYNGQGSLVAHIASLMLSESSNFILVSLLLLVSQGKCISYVMVAADVLRMCRLLGPFLLSCGLLELWGDFATSRTATTDYVYTSPCGWAIISVHLVLLGMYIANMKKTLVFEGNRGDGHFYRTWGVAFGVWFLALPVVALLSKVILAPYVCYVVSVSVTQSVSALVYGALVVGLWPENRQTAFKLIAATPEEILETCVTPPTRRQEASWPAELCQADLSGGSFQWLSSVVHSALEGLGVRRTELREFWAHSALEVMELPRLLKAASESRAARLKRSDGTGRKAKQGL